MIKTYKLDDKTEFKTITIPKGTLLFRGIDFSSHNPSEYYTEFINKNLCIPPTKNVYFYPVPYVSIAVNPFNVVILYTINYDLELLLLVKPSSHFKPNASEQNQSSNQIITLCGSVSENDKCNQPMSEDDPCFTYEFIQKFPHISGYVGLDAGDVERFLGHYRVLLKHGMTNRIKQIIPAIIENSRGFTGVPEIVLHPLHLRRIEPIKYKYDFSKPDRIISSLIRHRARFNYTPLLYITDKHVFTLNELLKYKNIEKMMKSVASDYIVNNKVFDNINKVMNKLLYEGYDIDDHNYTLYIDQRTGFYRVNTGIHNKNFTVKNKNSIMIEFDYPYENESSVSLSYPVATDLTDESIQGIEQLELTNSKESHLNCQLNSLKRTIVFNKGNYEKKYKIEEVFKRPEFTKNSGITMKRKTRKNKQG
jgi:hypothetical protein